jgi:hypothetical protein
MPNAVMVAMTANACGSSRGIDEFITERVEVVGETRKYRSFAEDTEPEARIAPEVPEGGRARSASQGSNYGRSCSTVGMSEGMGFVRRSLNLLSQRMAAGCYYETYIDMIADQVFTILRFCPKTGQSILAVVYPVVSLLLVIDF